jgi:predicted AAA+ superfamily ATPase
MTTTTTEISEVDLAKFNKWWTAEEFPPEDSNIEDYSQSKFKWESRLIKTFYSADCIYTLRGPRRVGKTTLLKLIIKSLLEKDESQESIIVPSKEPPLADVKGVSPENIFYFPCDSLYNRPFGGPNDLTAAIETYLKSTKAPDQHAYLFIDEITRVPEWQWKIKPLYDIGAFKECTIIFAASHIIDLRKESQALLDRRGDCNGRPYGDADRTLLQPKFSEYVETLDKAIHKEIRKLELHRFATRKQWWLKIISGELPRELTKLNLKYDAELDNLLSQYLITGGFGQAVHQYLSNGMIYQSTYDNFINIVMDDLRQWKRDEYRAKLLLARIIETITTLVSYNNLLKPIHHDTVHEYCKALSETFLINCHNRLGLHKEIPRAENSDYKKIYIRDPFMFHACRGWIAGEDAFDYSQEFLESPGNKSNLLEAVFSDHFSRFAFKEQNKPTLFKSTSHVFYWKSKKGKKKEVDFVIKMDDKCVAIEVKFRNEIKKDDTYGIRNFVADKHVYNRGIITSKNKFEVEEKFVIVPARILLLLI